MFSPFQFVAVFGLLLHTSLALATPATSPPTAGDELAGRASADFELTLDIWWGSYCCGGFEPGGGDCRVSPFHDPQVNPEITQRVGAIGVCKRVEQQPELNDRRAFSAKTRNVGQKLFGRNLKIKWYTDSGCSRPVPVGPVEDLTNKNVCHEIILGGADYFKLDFA